MIDLISYNVTYGDRFNNDRTDNIKIYYKSHLEKGTKVRIYLEDDIFNTESQYQDLNLGTGIFWSQFSSRGPHNLNNDRQITIPFIGPQKLIFLDNNGNTIKEFKLDIKFVDESLRGKNQKRCAWIIGDSHIGHLCKDIHYDELEYDKIRFNPLCRQSVTMSRFYKSDYINYLSYFPIKDNDVLLFNLGEIDMRMAIHVKNHQKKIDKKDLMTGIILNYLTAIKNISNKYDKNKIVILRPNIPTSDSYITNEIEKEQYLKFSNETDRKMLSDYFLSLVESFVKSENNISFVDNVKQYEINGFMDENLLLEQNIHMKSNKQYFDSLYEKIKNL